MARTDSIATIALASKREAPTITPSTSALSLPGTFPIIAHLRDGFACLSRSVHALRSGIHRVVTNLEECKSKKSVLTQLERFLGVSSKAPLTDAEKVSVVAKWLRSEDPVTRYLGSLLLIRLPVCQELVQVVPELASISHPKAYQLLTDALKKFPDDFKAPLQHAAHSGSTSAGLVLSSHMNPLTRIKKCESRGDAVELVFSHLLEGGQYIEVSKDAGFAELVAATLRQAQRTPDGKPLLFLELQDRILVVHPGEKGSKKLLSELGRLVLQPTSPPGTSSASLTTTSVARTDAVVLYRPRGTNGARTTKRRALAMRFENDPPALSDLHRTIASAPRHMRATTPGESLATTLINIVKTWPAQTPDLPRKRVPHVFHADLLLSESVHDEMAREILKEMVRLAISPSRYVKGLAKRDSRDTRPDTISLEGSLALNLLMDRVKLLGLNSATFFSLTLDLICSVAPTVGERLTHEVNEKISASLSKQVATRLRQLERTTYERFCQLSTKSGPSYDLAWFKHDLGNKGDAVQTTGKSPTPLLPSPLISPETLLGYLYRVERIVPVKVQEASLERRLKKNHELRRLIKLYGLEGVDELDRFRIGYMRELRELSTKLLIDRSSLRLASAMDLAGVVIDEPAMFLDAFPSQNDEMRKEIAGLILKEYRPAFLQILRDCSIVRDDFGRSDPMCPIRYSDIDHTQRSASARLNLLIGEWQRWVMEKTYEVSGVYSEKELGGITSDEEEGDSSRKVGPFITREDPRWEQVIAGHQNEISSERLLKSFKQRFTVLTRDVKRYNAPSRLQKRG